MSVDYNHGVQYLPFTVPRETRLTIDRLRDFGIGEQKNQLNTIFNRTIELSYAYHRIHPCSMVRLYKRRSMPNPRSVVLPRTPQVNSSRYWGCQSHFWRSLLDAGQWLFALWGVSLRSRPLDTPGLPLCSRGSRGHGMVPGKNALRWRRQQAHF